MVLQRVCLWLYFFDKRKEILDGAFGIQNGCLTGKNVLLFDDLYRSGVTSLINF